MIAFVSGPILTTGGEWLLMGIVLLVMVSSIAGGYKSFKRKRLLENIPTSKAAGVTMGLNELKGRVRCDNPEIAPLSGKPVVYYEYEVKEGSEVVRERNGRRVRETNWEQVSTGRGRAAFRLVDETGDVLIQPYGAEVICRGQAQRTVDQLDPLYYELGPKRAVSGSIGKRAIVERSIRQGESVYVMGPVEAHTERPEPVVQVPWGREAGELFLISALGERELIKRYNRAATKSFFGAIVLPLLVLWGIVEFWYAENLSQTTFDTAIVLTAAVIVLVPLIIAFLYLQSLYNGLVELRNRVHRAWAMLDVEFKRRHDLIPRLVRIVETAASHEKEVLKAVVNARMEGPSTSDPGGEDARRLARAVDSQTEALDKLFAVTERYPTLKTEPLFTKLMEQLVACEDQIALARGFYNDSVECVNNRVSTFPDMLLAPLAKTKKEDLLSFAEFEKKPLHRDGD